MPFEIETLWKRLVRGDSVSPADFAMRAGLSAASLVYGAGVRARNKAYDAGTAAVERVPAPVISIGNLSVGGTGKTSLVMWCARKTLDAGRSCAILSRGYKRTRSLDEPRLVSNGKKILGNPASAGDEPLLMARKLPAPVIVGADRVLGARMAVEKFNSPAIFLDDGFQHRRLHRDLDIVCVDDSVLESPHLFPRGVLREPAENLSRAHFLVIKTARDPREYLSLLFRATGADWRGPCAVFQYEADGVRDHANARDLELGWLRGRKVLACSAIAHPESFEQVLRQNGAELAGVRRFPDHHAWTRAEWKALESEAARLGASIVVTEKDAVKLEPDDAAFALSVRMRWTAGESELAESVARAAAKR